MLMPGTHLPGCSSTPLGGVLKAVPLTPVFILMAGTHLQHPPHTYNTHPTLTTPTPHKRQQPPHTSIKEHKNTK